MTALDFVATAGYGLGVLGIAGGVFSFLRFSNYKETVELQNDNINALKIQADVHENKINTQSKEIETLKQRNDIVESLPLLNIDSTLKDISSSNAKILDTLKSSAIVLATDTKDAANRAKEVKSDLSKDNTSVADAATIVRLTLIKNTADAALAAALVKTTLADGNKK